MRENKKSRGKLIGIIIAVVVVLIVLIVALTGFITDWMWFEEMGYVSVFFTEIKSKLLLGIPSFIIATLLCFGFLQWLRRSFLKKNEFNLAEKNTKKVNRIQGIISIIFGLIFSSITISNLWFEILEYMNASDFDVTDPLFLKDVGYYVFKLEFLNDMAGLLIRFAVLVFILTILFYLILLAFSDAKFTAKATNDDVEFTYSDEDGTEHTAEHTTEKDFTQFIKDAQSNIENYKNNGSLKKKLKALLGVAAGEISVLGILFFVAISGKFYLKQFDLL